MSAFNGSGVFTISGSGLPYVGGTVISSTVANQLNTDLATGLSTCITLDGQSTITNNIPFGGNKITGLALATAIGDALSYGRAATVTTLTLSGVLTAVSTGTGTTIGTDIVAIFKNTTAIKDVSVQWTDATKVMYQDFIDGDMLFGNGGAAEIARITQGGVISAMVGLPIPAGGATGSGYKFSTTANFGVFFGSGAPSLAAAKGSLYLRSDGSGTGDRAYINTNGSTTWTALTTAA